MVDGTGGRSAEGRGAGHPPTRAQQPYASEVDRASLRVLVVEDDPQLGDYLRIGLAAHGFQVDVVTDGLEGIRRVDRGTADLVILDLTLPVLDGLTVLERLRPETGLPVIVMSANTQLRDVALLRGADQFLAKPATMDSVVSSVVAAARRIPAPAPESPSTLVLGRVRMDLERRVITVGGEPVDLTAREFDLLVHFMASPMIVHTRDQLLRAVWDSSSDWQTPATVTEHVRRLRQKLGQDAGVVLETVRGVGYRLRDLGADG